VMNNYLSLLIFTFTGQAAAGMIMTREALIVTGRMSNTGRAGVRSQYLITVLLLFALATAFLHLHSPGRAIYALNNLKSSPLSMEIASLSLLVGISMIMTYMVSRRKTGLVSRGLQVMAVVAALLLLVTMIKVYMIPSVPAWYSTSTPLAFILTAISSGLAVMAVVTARELPLVTIRLMAFSVLSLVLLMFTLIAAGYHHNKLIVILIILQVITTFISVGLLFTLTSGSGMNKKYHLTVITATVIIISGILARLLFFLSFDNTIL
jgi:anaerobic dimethyl sulfoxide reductase subunit C